MLFFFVGARSFFEEADEVVAVGGDFGEPEMSGGVGLVVWRLGGEAFFCLEPGQRLLWAVGLSAWSRATTFLEPRRSS